MEFSSYKYKMIASVSILTAEKDRIKELINTYTIRLDSIYSSLLPLLDSLEKINYIENIVDEKERIINLIKFACNYAPDENKKIKKHIEEKYSQIETLGSNIHKSTEQHTITSSDDETTDEEHPGRNRLKNIIKKSKLKNGIKPANTERTTTTTTSSSTSDDDKTGETDDEEIEILKNNDDSNLKNIDDSNLKHNDENENNNDDENNNNNVEIDENKLKKEAFNKKRREQRMVRIFKKKEDEQNKNKIEISFN
jgi:hypothetical protein